MIDVKQIFLWSALLGVATPAAAQAAVAPEEARSSAPLATVITDDSVEVRVQGVTPSDEETMWKWGKLVVPIADGPTAAFAESYEDPTIKRVALVGGEKPRLIVMFRHGPRTAKKLTEASSITTTDSGFRVVIPRKHMLDTAKAEPVEVPAVVAEEPAKAEPVAQPAPKPEAKPEPEPAEVAPTAAAAEVAEVAPEGEPLNLPEPGATNAQASVGVGNSSMWGTLGFTLILLAIGGGFAYWKRKGGVTPGAPKGFTVMGNQVLGPKSRIVLMGLDNRRMLLAVNESGTTVVDMWTEGERHVPSTSARGAGGFDEESLAAIEFGGPVEPPTRTTTQRSATIRAYQPPMPEIIEDENAESTAVTGLLALRRRMEAAESESAEDDAWAEALASRMNQARSA